MGGLLLAGDGNATPGMSQATGHARPHNVTILIVIDMSQEDYARAYVTH